MNPNLPSFLGAPAPKVPLDVNAAAQSGGLANSNPTNYTSAIPGTAPVVGNTPAFSTSSPQVLGAETTAPTGTAGAGMNQGDYLSGIQQEYNSAIQGGSNAIAQNQANLPINQALLNNYVTAQQNAAQSQA